MKPSVLRILILLLAVAPVCAYAQNKDKPQLPRVLIIGDNVYSQHARGVVSELKGKAEVVMASWDTKDIASTQSALANVDKLLGYLGRDGKLLSEDQRPKWDLIHFNFGLGDLIHRVPDLKSFRVLPIHAGGVVNTPPDQYAANLDEFVERLKLTDAKLVWASTTPIRFSRSNVFRMGSEVEYNQIAEKVMRKHRLPINDMHAYAKSIMNMDKPAGHGADPFHFDKKQLHPPVVSVIADQLNIKLDKPAEDDKAANKN